MIYRLLILLILTGCSQNEIDVTKIIKQGDLQTLLNYDDFDITTYKDKDSNSVLVLAFEYEQDEIVDYCISNKIHLNTPNIIGIAPIHAAIMNQDRRHIDRLLEIKELDINNNSFMGTSPLYLSIHRGDIETVKKLLLKKNLDIKSISPNEKYSALIFASKTGELEIVKILVEHGADLHYKDINGQTAIDHARENNHTEIMTFLEKITGTSI
jgi:ankyrin repeat protein